MVTWVVFCGIELAFGGQDHGIPRLYCGSTEITTRSPNDKTLLVLQVEIMVKAESTDVTCVEFVMSMVFGEVTT